MSTKRKYHNANETKRDKIIILTTTPSKQRTDQSIDLCVYCLCICISLYLCVVCVYVYRFVRRT